jgi:hypothetical protein
MLFVHFYWNYENLQAANRQMKAVAVNTQTGGYHSGGYEELYILGYNAV